MNLHTLLAQRAASGRPVRVGLIGAGKFGSMILAQAQRIEGMHVVGIADLNVGRARASLARVGWPEARYSATSLGDAIKTGRTCVLDDAHALATSMRSNASSKRPATRSPASAMGSPRSKQGNTW